jgi:hypothetical protein
LLGYKTHADYQLEVRMSKNAAAVYEMFDKLIPRSLSFLTSACRLCAAAGSGRGRVCMCMCGCARGDRHTDSDMRD